MQPRRDDVHPKEENSKFGRYEEVFKECFGRNQSGILKGKKQLKKTLRVRKYHAD